MPCRKHPGDLSGERHYPNSRTQVGLDRMNINEPLLMNLLLTILTFYCLVKNNNYVITVLTLLLSVNFHVLVLII